MKHRRGLSETDRSARSQLHKLLEQADGMIHGTLIQSARRCGKANCRCATGDYRHQSWSLGATRKLKTTMKHVSQQEEPTVRRWVQAYQQARTLLDQISQEAWKRLAQGQE